MAAAAIFNQGMTAAQALRDGRVAPMAHPARDTNGTGDASGTSGDSATISANDFLTLLVTEMQNQDPTADTDPNEYINQLVSVNSLEQLIDINQTLTTGLGVTSASPDSGASAPIAGDVSAPAGAAGESASSGAHSVARVADDARSTSNAVSQLAPGNLGVPTVNAAAHQVAHALDGRMREKAGMIFPATR